MKFTYSVVLNLKHLPTDSAARLLRKKKGNTDISLDEFIRKCHWLKVKERIVFKICLIVQKCLYGVAPVSLKNSIMYSASSRTQKLNQREFKTSYGNRSFSRITPKLWNISSLNIRLETRINIFKNILKTYLSTCLCVSVCLSVCVPV